MDVSGSMIDIFRLSIDTDLFGILPNDIIFEIGRKMFIVYKIPLDMTIETLKYIGPYIYFFDLYTEHLGRLLYKHELKKLVTFKCKNETVDI